MIVFYINEWLSQVLIRFVVLPGNLTDFRQTSHCLVYVRTGQKWLKTMFCFLSARPQLFVCCDLWLTRLLSSAQAPNVSISRKTEGKVVAISYITTNFIFYLFRLYGIVGVIGVLTFLVKTDLEMIFWSEDWFSKNVVLDRKYWHIRIDPHTLPHYTLCQCLNHTTASYHFFVKSNPNRGFEIHGHQLHVGQGPLVSNRNQVGFFTLTVLFGILPGENFAHSLETVIAQSHISNRDCIRLRRDAWVCRGQR